MMNSIIQHLVVHYSSLKLRAQWCGVDDDKLTIGVFQTLLSFFLLLNTTEDILLETGNHRLPQQEKHTTEVSGDRFTAFFKISLSLVLNRTQRLIMFDLQKG